MRADVARVEGASLRVARVVDFAANKKVVIFEDEVAKLKAKFRAKEEELKVHEAALSPHPPPPPARDGAARDLPRGEEDFGDGVWPKFKRPRAHPPPPCPGANLTDC
jgi:hypothetical protein